MQKAIMLYVICISIFFVANGVEVDADGKHLLPGTVYVDDDFNESTPGWGHTHFNKIRDGINGVAENGTVYVYNGIYYENVVINKSINLTGEDRNATIIDGKHSGNYVINITANNVSISNFTIRNSGYAGIKLYSNFNNVYNCDISNNLLGILLYYSINNSIYNCNIQNNTHTDGICGYYSHNNTIYDCNISYNNWHGIRFWYSLNIKIHDCQISHNNNWNGITLQHASNNGSIYNCYIINNGYHGIVIDHSTNATVFNCYISGNNDGIRLWYAYNNTIFFNEIVNNNYGTNIENSNKNIVFHNNFINNTIQAYDNGNNIWDNGYPMGGNYWSDYITPDNKHGYYQNLSEFDLIVDCPYNISGGSNKDRWPHAIKDGWMKPIFTPNVLLVEFKQNVSNSTINTIIANYGTEIIEYLPYVNVYLLNITADNQSEFDTLYMFQNDTNVNVVSLDVYVYLRNKPEHLTASNDPCYPKQWHLNNYGINPGVPTGLIDADIDAPQAWEHLTDCRKDWNKKDFVIAIIDTGVDLNHPDIKANLWTNPNDPHGDIANDGIDNDDDGLIDGADPDKDGDPNPGNPDDDDNGIIDDVHGAEFGIVEMRWSRTIKNWFVTSYGDGSPDDEDGHGTHCAGIICAHGNNGIGATGVCWRAQLMVLKEGGIERILPDRTPEREERASAYRFDDCVDYILQQKNKGVNVKVVSYSAGVSRDDVMRWYNVNANRAEQIIRGSGLIGIYRTAIQKLNNDEILFVCAVGNNGELIDRKDAAGNYSDYPPKLELPNIIAVGASDNQDRLAVFSNWGTKSVDIIAPGENILSLAMHGRYVYRDNDGNNKVSAGDTRLTSEITAIYPAGSTVNAGDGDEGKNLHNIVNTAKYWDQNGNNIYDPGEYIYFDNDGNNVISAGDRRYHTVYLNGILTYHRNTIVNAGDSDTGNPLQAFNANEKVNYSSIYRDVDNDNRISAGDIRLTNVESFFRVNTNVQAGNSDVGDCLHSFAANEKHTEDVNANGLYDVNEDIYIDNDNSNTVTVGDQRLRHWRYPPGSFVEVGDRDINLPLVNFQPTEKYSLVTYMSGTSMATPMVAGSIAHFWCQFPKLKHLQIKEWLLKKVDPRATLQKTVVSGKNHDGRLRMISGFDFGDAPDPLKGVPHKYPTILDNDKGTGASHEDIGEEWLGWDVSPEYDANVVTDPPYDVDGLPNLWPPRVPSTPHPPYQPADIPDLDAYDDGVTLPLIVFRGGIHPIVFHIQTENPFIHDVDDGRYDEFRAIKNNSKKIYINTYFDWNRDGDWDDVVGGINEHLIKCPAMQCTWWGGPNMTCCYNIFWPSWNWLSNIFPFLQPLEELLNENAWRRTTFTVPWNAEPGETWVRVRLDYGENAGKPPYPGHDSDWPFTKKLKDTYSHAQFGEVEDYWVYIISKTKVIGEPSYYEGEMIWLTSYTPIELIDEPEPPYPVENWYRIWYNGTWTPWMLYNGTFYLEGAGLHYIEYYGKAVESNRTIFYDDFNDSSRWATIDLDGSGYTWQWTNITPPWIDEPVEGHFMLFDQYAISELELPNHGSLVSAPISCQIFNNTMLYFDGTFKTTGNEKLWVNISTDYENWTNVLTLDENESGPWIINISSIADGNIIAVNFTYSSPPGTGYGALIDDVYIYGDVITYSPVYNQSHIVDDTPPIATINAIVPYVQSSIPLEITYNASDDEGCGVKEVTLYFRYSYDNETWSEWQRYASSNDGKWLFYAPYAPAYYQFYSIAIDNLNNSEVYEEGVIEAAAYITTLPVFDTGTSVDPYPSIAGIHYGAITPFQTIYNVSRLYTYPCTGTGGHTEYVAFYADPNRTEKITEGYWNGYTADDWHNVSFPAFTMFANHTYYYIIKTGSYPQIIHNRTSTTYYGTINCTSFVDVNGRSHRGWIPAIRLTGNFMAPGTEQSVIVPGVPFRAITRAPIIRELRDIVNHSYLYNTPRSMWRPTQ